MCASVLHRAKMYLCLYFLEHTGEAGLSREEHAGQTTFRPFHYSETWSLIHRAVDRRLRLSKNCQVRTFLRLGAKMILEIVNVDGVDYWPHELVQTGLGSCH